MKQFLLTHCNPSEDVDFLNNTPIVFEFLGEENDTGWCDAYTGCRILNKHDKIVFTIEGSDEEAVLRYKFGDRLAYFKSSQQM